MKQGTANLAEDYCFIHKALRPVGTAANCRGAALKFEACMVKVRILLDHFFGPNFFYSIIMFFSVY